jgi:hypothetical protein
MWPFARRSGDHGCRVARLRARDRRVGAFAAEYDRLRTNLVIIDGAALVVAGWVRRRPDMAAYAPGW